MKSIVFAIALTVLFASHAFPQDKPVKDTPKEKPAPTQEQLEAKFKAMMTKATLTGRWCSVKDGKLGPDKEDKYTIVSATKIGATKWLINAKIEVHQSEGVIPVPVDVKWAGDTAVLCVDGFPMPGGGTFTARVLFYEHTYAGTWNGGDHAGLINGVITNQSE